MGAGLKILIFCPTTKRLSSKTLEAIFKQDVEQYDVMQTRDNPYPLEAKLKNIQHNFEKMRETMWRGVYDKVWIVEEDIIPPPDALSKLLWVDAAVVSGLYIMRHGNYIPNIMLMGSGGPEWATHCDITHYWGEVIPIAGGCTGCLLVDRTALPMTFMQDNTDSPDIAFMAHCRANGIEQMVHLGVVCGHVNGRNEVLHPSHEYQYTIEQVS